MPEPGACIQVVFGEVDRRVEVRLDDDATDASSDELTDELLRALIMDDPDEAEDALREAVAGVGSVRRLP